MFVEASSGSPGVRVTSISLTFNGLSELQTLVSESVAALIVPVTDEVTLPSSSKPVSRPMLVLNAARPFGPVTTVMVSPSEFGVGT